MRFGVVIVPDLPWPQARDLWRRAEELGFDHAWTYDHLAWRTLRDSDWFAAVPTLAAAATATARIRLGTLVASPNFRHPVALAKELVTLDHICGGRLTFGVGAGAYGWDATMFGQVALSRRDRADRFVEFVELMDRLLRSPMTSFEGRFYVADGARTIPGCVQQPRVPFAVAAAGPRGMGVAIRHAHTWVTTGEGTVTSPAAIDTSLRAVRVQMAQMEELCGVTGRDFSSLRRLVVTGPLLASCLESVEAFRDAAGRYEEAGASDLVVHWPRSEEPYAADVAAFERIFSA